MEDGSGGLSPVTEDGGRCLCLVFRRDVESAIKKKPK
jgi:hypothetical protein